jgi:long-subunit acyl-CoA synthetase (AMP-forming)
MSWRLLYYARPPLCSTARCQRWSWASLACRSVSIQAAVDDTNQAVSRAEAIKRFAILDEDFTEAGGQLTPTLKVRRNVVMEQYATLIAALYVGRAS